MIIVMEIGGQIRFFDFKEERISEVTNLEGFIYVLERENSAKKILINKSKIVGIFPDATSALAAIGLGQLSDDQLASHEIQAKNL
jgi:hypothetical protein